jgi:hypothetical protein
MNSGGFPAVLWFSWPYTAGMRKNLLQTKLKIADPRGRGFLVFLTCVLVSGACMQAASADSFRCGRKVVRSGDSPADLLARCGEPRHKDKAYEDLRVRGSQKKVRVERWYYKKNSRSLEQVVLIHKGRIIAIKSGQR